MAIANYTNLIAAITNWMDRGTVLDTYRDDFIALAESRIVRDLKETAELDVNTTLTVDAASKDLPTDFAGMKYIELNGTAPPLDYFTPDDINSRYASNQTSKPIAYTIQANKIYFYPSPDTTYTATYTYTAKPDIKTDTTNRLLTLYPDIYLFACLVEAAIFDDDAEKEQRFMRRYMEAVQSIQQMTQHRGALSIRVGDVP